MQFSNNNVSWCLLLMHEWSIPLPLPLPLSEGYFSIESFLWTEMRKISQDIFLDLFFFFLLSHLRCIHLEDKIECKSEKGCSDINSMLAS